MLYTYNNYITEKYNPKKVNSLLYLNESYNSGIPEPGDYVKVTDKTNKDRKKQEENVEVPVKVLPEDAHEYLLSQDKFRIIGAKKNTKKNWCIDIGCISRNTGDIYWFLLKRFKIIDYTEEKEGFTYFKLSKDIEEKLRQIKNPISSFILDLRKGVPNDKIKPGFVNYFGVDKKKKGHVTCIRNDEVGDRVPVEEAWTSNRRQGSTFLKIIRRIFTPDFMKILDVEWAKKEKGAGKVSIAENFSKEWQFIFDDEITVKLLTGDDILIAFNYHDDFDNKTWDVSCANFHQKKYGGHYNEPKVEDYNFYTKNPGNCGVLGVFRQGKIYGRAPVFFGNALYTHGTIKKGEFYYAVNRPYTNKEQKYKAAIAHWIKNTKNAFSVGDELLIIPFKTKVCEKYPPVDGVNVNIKSDMLASKYPTGIKGIKGKWVSAYSLNVKSQLK